ncbi:response regulator transcription factor [Litorihabitans aurantiacus]|nr:response regulator transcription factor [Litorihabitans aurantiacus]
MSTSPVPHPAGPASRDGADEAATRVLVVEDSPEIATQISRRFTAEGWQVRVAVDGPAGVADARDFAPHAIVLDVMLPGFDGLEVCRQIQADDPRAVPILMLTARDDETDLLVGLGVGADDYMTKPFSMRELVARVKALLRRHERTARVAAVDPSAPAGPAPIELGDLVVDRAQRRVSRGGQEAHLTPTEFDLLVCLALSPRTVLTRERLLEEVWDWVDASGTRTVDSHIKALRRKLGPDLVRTVHGVGYSLEPPTP